MSDSIAIIGLGAIGGSLALDLAAANTNVVGYDVDPLALHWAEQHNIDAHRWGGCVETGRVVIAVPVSETAGVLQQLSKRTDYELITDVCSTKRRIVSEALRLGLQKCFVGAHPLAGTHESGPNAARRELFREHTVFICPTSHGSENALALTTALWQSVGGLPVITEPILHDREMAWLSHLPQLTANALALTMKSGGFSREDMGPGGQEMTRLAGSNADLWEGILEANADMLDEPLACMIDALAELRAELRRGDSTRLLDALRTSAQWHAAHCPK